MAAVGDRKSAERFVAAAVGWRTASGERRTAAGRQPSARLLGQNKTQNGSDQNRSLNQNSNERPASKLDLRHSGSLLLGVAESALAAANQRPLASPSQQVKRPRPRVAEAETRDNEMIDINCDLLQLLAPCEFPFRLAIAVAVAFAGSRTRTRVQIHFIWRFHELARLCNSIMWLRAALT